MIIDELSMDELEVCLRNKRTGEILKTVNNIRYSKERWQKVVASQIAAMYDVMGNSSTRFISYLITKKDNENRIFGSYNDMAKASGVSRDTIARLVPKLKRAGFIKAIIPGAIHQISPHVLRPGEKWKGAILVQLWNDAGKVESL